MEGVHLLHRCQIEADTVIGDRQFQRRRQEANPDLDVARLGMVIHVLQRFLSQPFTVTEAFTGVPGRSVAVADTIAGCKAILAGDCDNWQESSLYMIGTIDEARAREAASSTPPAAGVKPEAEAKAKPAAGHVES